VGDAESRRGEELEKLAFQTYDALHLACAESGRADVFLTTDDRLLRVAKRVAASLKVRVANPLDWLREGAAP
jgi:predicted nucleic acid-binding protein